MHKRVGLLVLAHDAAGTVPGTLDRIPADFRDRIEAIIILDDASADDTFPVAAAWARRNRLAHTTVLRHTKHLGHGGTRKAGLRLAIEHGLDVVALLPGDGRYAPESLPALVRPILDGDADAVFGVPEPSGGERRVRQACDRALMAAGERLLGSSLSGVHADFRAYGTAALRAIPFEANADGPDFDTQLVVQLRHEGKRIVEVPVHDADEVSGLRQHVGVVRNVLEYRRVSLGIGTSDWVPRADRPAERTCTSHTALLTELAELPKGRVLDLGCGSGRIAQQARALGHRVVGVDRAESEGVRDRLNLFVRADLDNGIPQEAHVAAGYDVVVAADVLQYLAHPDRLLREIHGVLRPGGQVLVCVPNGVHWYPRLRFASGFFDYDRRGILDANHLRFFSRRSLRRLLVRTGYDVLDEQVSGLPRFGQQALARALPSLFGYQLIARLTPHHEDTIAAPSLADEVFGAHYGSLPRQQERRRQQA